MAYGYERMSSLVPELVKKRCKSINAETNVSVTAKSLLVNLVNKTEIAAKHFMVVPGVANVAAACA